MAAAARLEVRITLLGRWIEIDPTDPLPGREHAELRDILRTAGLEVPTPPPDGRFVLGAVLREPPLPEHTLEPPMLASLAISEHENAVTARVCTDGSNGIVPIRRVSHRSADWPSPGVGNVEFLQVTYLVPSPDGRSTYIATFTTPNLPIADDMEFLFDSIMATMVWVEDTDS